MKKLLTLAVLALSAFGLHADPVVDTFTYQNLAESPSNFTTYTGTYNGNVGTYSFCMYNGYKAAWFNKEYKTYVSGEAEGHKITMVEREGGTKNFVMVYASNEALTYDNCASAPFSAELYSDSQVEITGDYKYVFVRLAADATDTANFDSLNFTWDTAGGSSEPTTASDDINIAAFKAQFPDFTYNSPYSTPVVNPDCELVFENGAKYKFVKMVGGYTQVDNPWWMLDTDGYFTVSEPAPDMWIESVEVKGDNWCNQVKMAFGAEALTSENYSTAGDYDDWISMTDHQVVHKPLAPSKYLYFNQTRDCYYNVIVNWTSEMPVYQVSQPIIECYETPVTNASNVNIRLPYSGAKIKLEVYVKEEGATDYTLVSDLSKTYDERSISIPMPGGAGAMVKFVAVGVRENCQDSEPAETIYGPLEMADAPAPILNNNDRYVFAGGKVSVAVGTGNPNWGEPFEPIENANIKYQYNLKDADGTVVTAGDEVTGTTNPVEVAVPATAVPGQTFEIIATSIIPDRKDNTATFSLPVISDVLPAPTFSLPSGSDMPAGSKIRVIKPEFADSLFFTVNGGEVQKYTWSPDVEIKEESVIEAWATSKNLKPSEHVTATFKIEVLEAWMDAIEPSCFVDGTEWQSYTAEARNYESTNTGVTYLYNGKFMTNWNVHNDDYSVYGGNFDFYPATYLTNINAYDKKGESQIKSIKIDSDKSGSVYVAFSDEVFEPVTTDSDLCKADYAGDIARVTVGGSNAADKDYLFGQWIELKGLDKVEGDGTKYFMVFSGENNYIELSRVVVHYWDPKDGVSTIVTEDVDGAIYSINGYRVNSENLAPGVYVRKQNGKTVKFVVK